MPYPKTLAIAALGAAALLVAAPARALPWRAFACRGDFDRFCKDVPRGGGRVLVCLQNHLADLSPDCREFVGSVKIPEGGTHGGLEFALAVHRGCGSEIGRFCGDVPIGAGKVVDCLQGHQAELSAGCKAALASPPKGD
jgi:Cysteine rich repeat